MPDFISPPQYIQVSNQVCKIQVARLATVVAADQPIIAAVAGYVHRIMGWKIYAQGGGATGWQLKAGAGGAVKTGGILPAGGQDTLPIFEGGYFELATNQALVADVNTTGNDTNIFYITFIPPPT